MIARNMILQGDTLSTLRGIESDSADLVVFSPPYWQKINYGGQPDQIGLEPNFRDYLRKMIDILRELKRIIKPTGSIYLNIGDTRNGDKKGNTNGVNRPYVKQRKEKNEMKIDKRAQPGIMKGGLLGIPERLVVAAMDELGLGYIETVIWDKPNSAPEGKHPRFIINYEPVLFFVKSPDFYFDWQYEPASESTLKDMAKGKLRAVGGKKFEGKSGLFNGKKFKANPRGALKRAVFRVSVKGYGEHLAAYPPALIEPIIRASCPSKICSTCGHMVTTEYDEETFDTRPGLNVLKGKSGTEIDPKAAFHRKDISLKRQVTLRTNERDVLCEHLKAGGPCERGLVLDPFFGSGTTGVVARQLGRDYLGIELNPAYIELATRRLEQAGSALPPKAPRRQGPTKQIVAMTEFMSSPS